MLGDPSEEQDTSAPSALAKVLGEKIARKLKIPQLFMSLNISQHSAESLKSDFKTLAQLSQQICELVEQLV